jgi:MSHA biogenesis protein MshN
MGALAVSLINKMLKDLETRQAAAAPPPGGRAIFQDLQPVNHDRRRVPGLVIGTLLTVGLVAAGYFGVTHWDSRSMPTADNSLPAVVATPASTAVDTTATLTSPVPAPAVSPPASATATLSTTLPTPAKLAAAHPSATKPPATAIKAAKVEAPPNTGAHIERTEQPYTADELAENAYRDAAQLRAQGNPAEAERRLKTLLVSHPKLIKARELLANIQLDSGRWVEAQDTLEQGVALTPEYLAFRFQLARLYLEHGADEQALTLLESARHEGRTDPELYAFLAALYERGGRHADAVKNYQDALALRPVEGKWWLGLGISLEGLKNNTDARTAYRRALESGRLSANLSHYAEDRLRTLAAH